MWQCISPAICDHCGGCAAFTWVEGQWQSVVAVVTHSCFVFFSLHNVLHSALQMREHPFCYSKCQYTITHDILSIGIWPAVKHSILASLNLRLCGWDSAKELLLEFISGKLPVHFIHKYTQLNFPSQNNHHRFCCSLQNKNSFILSCVSTKPLSSSLVFIVAVNYCIKYYFLLAG